MLRKTWGDHLDFFRKANEISRYLEEVGDTSEKFLRNNIYVFNLEEMEKILTEEDKYLCENADCVKLIYYNEDISIYGIENNDRFENFILINDWNDEEQHYFKKEDYYINLLERIDYKVLTTEECSNIMQSIDKYREYLCNIINSQYFDNYEICEGKACNPKDCHKCKNLNNCIYELEQEIDDEEATNEYWTEYFKFNPHER